MGSYFGYGTIEEEILSDTQYTQRQKNASNLDIVKALIKVLDFYAEQVESEKKKGLNNE